MDFHVITECFWLPWHARLAVLAISLYPLIALVLLRRRFTGLWTPGGAVQLVLPPILLSAAVAWEALAVLSKAIEIAKPGIEPVAAGVVEAFLVPKLGLLASIVSVLVGFGLSFRRPGVAPEAPSPGPVTVAPVVAGAGTAAFLFAGCMAFGLRAFALVDPAGSRLFALAMTCVALGALLATVFGLRSSFRRAVGSDVRQVRVTCLCAAIALLVLYVLVASAVDHFRWIAIGSPGMVPGA